MLNLIYCELAKLKHSKIVFISTLGVMATPVMLFIESIRIHFEHPEQVFTLADVYDNSLLYIMLLTNIMIYIAITAYLFSREYTEKTFKTILPIPISRTKLLISKFFTLFIWMTMLTFVTWAGILILSGIYNAIFGMVGFGLLTAMKWLLTFLLSNILMFTTISPFAYIAMKTKGFVSPIIVSAVIVMGSAALCNQDFGALYPWTATFFIIKGKIQSTGYPIDLVVVIIAFLSITSFLMTFNYFKKEDLK